MNKKKFIGTVIGVIAFIALIAGATFAWYTYNITLNKAGYNFTSSNFSIVYGHGDAITGVKIYSGEPTASNFTGATDGKVDITAKTTGSIAGKMSIYLYVDAATTDTLITSGALKYAVCEGSTTIANTSYKGTIQNATVSNVEGKQNVIAANIPVNTTSKTFHVYIWLDAATYDGAGGSFTGHIGATATQNQ